MSNMDERTMIREQERLAKEAKQKKTKKYKIIFGTLTAVLLAGGVWYAGWGRKMLAQEVSTAVKIEKSVGQEVVYAQIKSIYGNEITYAAAEAAEETQTSEKGQTETSPQGERPSMGGFPGGGEMPDMSGGFPGGGEMPDMSGGFPGGGERPNRGESGRGENTVSSGRTETNQFTYENTTYRVGTETVTTYIPVGTDVTTKLGTVTTFSRLTAGDYVALVTEKDGDETIITAVYIIG